MRGHSRSVAVSKGPIAKRSDTPVASGSGGTDTQGSQKPEDTSNQMMIPPGAAPQFSYVPRRTHHWVALTSLSFSIKECHMFDTISKNPTAQIEAIKTATDLTGTSSKDSELVNILVNNAKYKDPAITSAWGINTCAGF